MLLSQALQKVEAPKAATTSRSVLAGIMNTPASMRRFKVPRTTGHGVVPRASAWGLQRPLLLFFCVSAANSVPYILVLQLLISLLLLCPHLPFPPESPCTAA